MSEKPHPIEQGWAELTSVDKLIHEPARLSILTILSVVERADFLYLKKATQLTKGNLSAHLQKLEAANLIEIEKTYQGKTPRTLCRLTAQGQQAFDQYKQQMRNLLGDG
jgi:DNA-binding MarR family transcriptional regulator